jgi:hypothetical protein
MDSKQKYTEESNKVIISENAYKKIRSYGIRGEIYDTLDYIVFGEEDLIVNLAFRVNSDRFFVGDFYFESETIVYLDDLNEIGVNKFLDFINEKQYINYGV